MNDEGLADAEPLTPFVYPDFTQESGFAYTSRTVFFSFGERDHDIAVIKAPDERPVGSSGLAHTALEIEGAGEQLRELYGRLKRFGARVEFTTDHVLTKSVYFFDPGGNRLEIFSQELSSASAKQYLHEAQAAADVMRPLDLETATSTGRLSS